MNRKRSAIALFLFVIFTMSLQSQVAKHYKQQEQDSFGTDVSPGMPAVHRPLPIPDAVMQTLKLDEEVKGCLSDNPLAPGQFLNSWFIASEIHLDGPTESDLIIIPIPNIDDPHYICFHSNEEVGWFWIYRKIGEQYQLVLKAAGNTLYVAKKRTDGYKNIQTLSQIGMNPITTITYCFDGKLYQECRRRPEQQ